MNVRPPEQRLIDLIAELPVGRTLCNTVGRGQLAVALAARDATAPVTCHFLDLFPLQETQAELRATIPNLRLVCQPDPPPDEVGLATLAFSHRGEAELVRDLLQSAHDRLAIGGRLAAAIDNPDDQWLHEQLRGMFDKVTCRRYADAVVYLATKTRPLKKHREFACELTYRDGERLIHLRTRPGVFSHRWIDDGARALVKSLNDAANPADQAAAPAAHVLDLGCGCGIVGLVAALRYPQAQVQAIDSNPRAIEAAEWAARKNGATNLTAALDCDGRRVESGKFDLVLTNPPYFSNFRIAGLFVAIAQRALKPGGTLLLVTKTPQWYLSQIPRVWSAAKVQAVHVGKYVVISATSR
jgi:16S rRNA (guanine1207-N2)-methyltransferase